MSSLAFIVRSICLLVLLQTGDIEGREVILTVYHDSWGPSSSCLLPPLLKVNLRLEDAEQEEELPLSTEIGLIKRQVSQAEKFVNVMERNEDGETVITPYRVYDTKALESQAYHNHTTGASFVVGCAIAQSGQKYLHVEGSVHLSGQKFRISPAALRDDSHLEFVSQGTVMRCNMEALVEHPTIHAKGVHSKPQSQRDTRLPFSRESIANENHQTSDLKYRYRRSTSTYYIDILPVVDFSLYSRWLERMGGDADAARSEISSYLLNIMSAVDMRLQTLSVADVNFQARMVTPFLATEIEILAYEKNISKCVIIDIATQVTETQVSALNLLERFADWVSGQTSLESNDHVMLFTSYNLIASDICPEIQTTNETRGLAYISTLCKEKSISLIEDKGAYQSENVAAHELVHSLGARHDGDGNNCSSSDRYIMATGSFNKTDENELNPWRFSSCTSEAVATYMNELAQTQSYLDSCLLNQTGQEANNLTTMNPDTICVNIYGEGAFTCRNYEEFSDVCTDFYCRIPNSNDCEEAVSATGMCCGNGKKCLAGSCIDAESGECPLDDVCPLGDQPVITGTDLTTTTCGELNSISCYEEAIAKACCLTCQNYETNITDCAYGDRKNCTLLVSAADCTDEFRSDCCETCARLDAEAPTTSEAPTTAAPAEETTDRPSTEPPTDAPTDPPTTQRPTSTQRSSGCYLPPCRGSQLQSLDFVVLLTLAGLYLVRVRYGGF